MTDGRVHTDSSITSFDEDKLERGEFARRVADRIRMAGSGPSIVFGLAGSWGSGKTSVLNMIRLELEKSQSWVVAEFTPWAASDLDALTVEFYEVIASAMPQQGENAKTARKMLMSAAPIAASVAKVAVEGLIDRQLGAGTWKKILETTTSTTIDQIGSYAPTPDPFRRQFAAMSNAIESTGAQVLVLVDDLDRLHTDELLAVMKAVRLLGRFPGVHYLLSYDKRTVLDLIRASDLAGTDPGRAHAYLEKIVQYPFELPPLQPMHSRREVTEQITAIAHRYEYDLPGTDSTHERPWDLIDELLALLPFVNHTTLRAIYRWCTQVDVMLALLGPRHLDLLDAALITYLRLHHEHIYDRLPGWRYELVGDALNHVVFPATKRDTAENWLARLRDDDSTTDERELTDVYKILVYLFPRLPRQLYTRTRPHTRTPQVHHDEFFDRYFTFGLPAGDISDVAAAQEVSSLVLHKALPESGVLRTFLESGGDRQKLALSKLSRELEPLVISVSAESSVSILEHLWPSLLGGHGQLSWIGPGVTIATMLIVRAIDASSDSAHSRAALNQIRQHIGLQETTTLLSQFRQSEGRVDYPANITEAIVDMREEVLQACMTDLTSSVQPPGARVLSFIYFLTTEMYAELRHRIDSADLTQLDVATRMVRVGSTMREGLEGNFYRNPFAELYPYAEWDLTLFPDPPLIGELPEPHDHSVEARQAQATYAVHTIVSGEQ